jgi:hypothetical protein
MLRLAARLTRRRPVMAILMRSDLPDFTADEFEALGTRVLSQLNSAPGFIAHASGPIQGGYQVTEVWESREAHERWLYEHIIPTLQQLGMRRQPTPPQYLPLDRFFTH